MAKTVGCMLTVASRNDERGEIRPLAEELGNCEGNLGGGSYGYEFDVQTRWAFYPAGSPNLIATVFVARALASASLVTGDDLLWGMAKESAAFLLSELYEPGDSPCFRYTLTSDRLVHNANFLGSGLVSTIGALGHDAASVTEGLAAAKTSTSAQREDGWPYGEGASLSWSDNFHTAYNLDGLLQVWLATGDPEVKDSLDRGVAHWVRDFFGPNGEPKYYPHKAYPYDIHSAGTAVDVAARLATWGYQTGELAENVERWTRRHLVTPCGTTYYQRHRFWTDKRHFVRWGDAHWELGESSLTLMHEGRQDPLEAAVAKVSGVGR